MALPSSRVIGHKEYAAGRKSDPTYSMDWRRQRVAAFKPRNAPTPSPEDDVDDATMDKIADKVVAKLMKAEVSKGKTFGPAVSQVHTALCELIESPLSPDVTGGPEDGPVKPVTRAKMIEFNEARSRRQARDMADVLALLQGGSTPPTAA